MKSPICGAFLTPSSRGLHKKLLAEIRIFLRRYFSAGQKYLQPSEHFSMKTQKLLPEGQS